MRTLLFCLLLSPAVAAAEEADEAGARKIAEQYLRDATGGGGGGKQLLLGGVGMDAELLELDNATVVGQEPIRHETASLESAHRHVAALDQSGREALAKLVAGPTTSDELAVSELSRDEALRLMAPTRERAKRFGKAHPVLAFATRVDKEVYWHPKNPMRSLLQRAGREGQYALDLLVFKVQSREGPNRSMREWPLRVLRFRSGRLDTGWKVLPASSWEPQ